MKNFGKYALCFVMGATFATAFCIWIRYEEEHNIHPVKRNWIEIKGNHWQVGGWYDWEWHTVMDGDTIIVKTANYK